MTNLVYIQENNLLNAPSINLLNNFMMFDSPFTWNVAGGSGTAVNLIGQSQLQGNGCLRVTGSGLTVNSGGTQTQLVVKSCALELIA